MCGQESILFCQLVVKSYFAFSLEDAALKITDDYTLLCTDVGNPGVGKLGLVTAFRSQHSDPPLKLFDIEVNFVAGE